MSDSVVVNVDIHLEYSLVSVIVTVVVISHDFNSCVDYLVEVVF